MIGNIDRNNYLAKQPGPGGWNDSDILEAGNGGMTDTEYFFLLIAALCNSICPEDQLCCSPNICTCPSGSTTSPCQPQSTGLCPIETTANSQLVFLVTFGNGTHQYSSATPGSFGFSTTYRQVFGGAPDHTENNHTASIKGYMMLINANFDPDQIFNLTADNLCIGSTYQFSLYVANINKAGSNIILPNIKFEVRTAPPTNILLATLSTGNIAERSTLTWVQYGISFIATVRNVVLVAISNAPGGSGNDFAIDDVSLTVCSTTSPAICTE
ncbi:unnamed protein product [Rotaria sp. Silwood1]|nr:unnamed protein product [Rotaria sp. Silwood1]